MRPKSLLDRSFRYTPSFATNLKSTFDRVRRQMRQEQANSAGKEEPEVNIVSIERTPTRRLG